MVGSELIIIEVLCQRGLSQAMRATKGPRRGVSLAHEVSDGGVIAVTQDVVKSIVR